MGTHSLLSIKGAVFFTRVKTAQNGYKRIKPEIWAAKEKDLGFLQGLRSKISFGSMLIEE